VSVRSVSCSRHSVSLAARCFCRISCSSASSGWPAAHFRERPTLRAGEVDAEDGARGVVRDADAEVRLQRDDAAREAREHDRERRALGLGRRTVTLSLLARAGELLRHVVERGDEVADLVVRRALDARVEVALRDGPRAGDQVLHRAHEPLGEIQGAVHRREQRHQQHQREGQHERCFQRLAQVREPAVLLEGVLHVGGEVGEPLRHRIGRDQEARRLHPVARADPRCRSHLVAAALRRLQAHVRPALAQLEQQVLGRDGGQLVLDARATVGDRLAARARHDDLVRAGAVELRLEREVQRAARHAVQPVGEALRALEVLAHAEVKRRARKVERVRKPLAHLRVEPAVDAARQEDHREGEHEEERRDREAAEHEERAARSREPGTCLRQSRTKSASLLPISTRSAMTPATLTRRMTR
jgi:hypothetical protein